MTGGFEAAGDIATGAFMGRSVEPAAGEHVSGAHGHGACLNCGTQLIGEFCHVCGQNGHVHKTLASIGHDLLHGVFHFEGKIWRTLPMLVVKPGALTRRYIAGERAKFVSPLALFLFSVFLMFAVIHAIGGEFDGEGLSPVAGKESVAQFNAATSGIDQEIAAAKDRLAKARTTADRKSATTELAALQGSRKAVEAARNVSIGVEPGERATTIADFKTGWPRLDAGIAKANANPGLAIYKLQASAYKYSWALIPISVPFVALLFLWRRRYRLYDHTIFVIYSLDFMTLLVTVLTIAGEIGVPTGLIATVGTFGPPIHLYKQLRGAYQLRRFSAFWRMCALVVFAFLALTLFIMLLLGLGLMG
jgi:hypothetical protein